MTQFHLPYLQSVEYNHTATPLSQPQNQYYFSSFPDHLSTAVERQVMFLHLSIQNNNQTCYICSYVIIVTKIAATMVIVILLNQNTVSWQL